MISHFNKKITVCLIIIAQLWMVSVAYGYLPIILRGTDYLGSTQNLTGSWGDPDSSLNPLTTEYFGSTEVLDTLKILGQDSTLPYQNGLQWLQAQTDDNTAYVSRRISVLASAGVDVTTDVSSLISYRNADGGWGGHLTFESTNYHTALALQALKTVNYSDSTVTNSAIDYLLSSQNPDGGWGLCQSSSLGCADGEGDSNVYMTALVSLTLQQFPQTTTIATAINKATAYLLSHQNADGGFGAGTSPAPTSSIFETAYAYIALVGVITDNTVLGNAVNYLTSTQLPDGSWEEDPYSTALALRALYYSENVPTPPPSPTSGTVTGRVVDASTRNHIGDVVS